MNVDNYILMHTNEVSYLKSTIKDLKNENESIKNDPKVKQAWINAVSERKFIQLIEAGNRMANRKKCSCSMDTTTCPDCQKSISEWNKIIGKGTKQ